MEKQFILIAINKKVKVITKLRLKRVMTILLSSGLFIPSLLQLLSSELLV